MHELYELKDQLMKELEEYGRKGELTAGSLEVVDKLAHTVKNLCKIIEAYEEEEGEGYSMEDGSRGGSGRSYARGGGQGQGTSYRGMGMRSYARGRRRDSRGRYSSDNRYSYANDDMVEQLESLMEDAPDQIKQDIQRIITKVESM